MSKSATIVTSALVGAGAALAGGIMLELWKEKHAKEKDAKKAILAGAIEDAQLKALDTPGVMPEGYWQTVVDAESWSEVNPLDDVVKSKLVRIENVSGFGAGASKMWIKIFVPKKFKGAAGIALRGWTDWKPATAALKPKDAISPEAASDSYLVWDITDAANQRAREVGKKIDAIVESTRNTILVAGGVAFVGWLLVSSRRR